jgi:hypothetical protein
LKDFLTRHYLPTLIQTLNSVFEHGPASLSFVIVSSV